MPDWLTPPAAAWIVIGLAGQACFFLRFAVQWIASERAGRSVVPCVFWHLSIAGSLVILSYAMWRRDPVFILGQSTGLLIYVRNLVLIRREEDDAAGSSARPVRMPPTRTPRSPGRLETEIRASGLE